MLNSYNLLTYKVLWKPSFAQIVPWAGEQTFLEHHGYHCSYAPSALHHIFPNLVVKKRTHYRINFTHKLKGNRDTKRVTTYVNPYVNPEMLVCDNRLLDQNKLIILSFLLQDLSIKATLKLNLNLRANVCKNRAKSKFRGYSQKIIFAHILSIDRHK